MKREIRRILRTIVLVVLAVAVVVLGNLLTLALFPAF